MTVEVKKTDPINSLYKKCNLNKDVKLLFDGNIVDISSNETFEEMGINEDYHMTLIGVFLGGEVGSSAKTIADPEKKPPVEWPTVTEGPSYLTVKNGINLFGICHNEKCLANEKEVCSPFGFGTFDLIEDLTYKSNKCPKCPLCEHKILELETCGFMNCKYEYKWVKWENSEFKKVNFNKTTKGGYKALDYILPGNNGENKSKWIELKISATSLWMIGINIKYLFYIFLLIIIT